MGVAGLPIVVEGHNIVAEGGLRLVCFATSALVDLQIISRNPLQSFKWTGSATLTIAEVTGDRTFYPSQEWRVDRLT